MRARHHGYWIIVDGAVPTAFRARRSEDLLPTLKQLQRMRPESALRWFERGRFWLSPEAALEALRERRRQMADRGPAWRPGGKHEDPRAKYRKTRDQKRADFKRRKFAARPEGPQGPPPGRPAYAKPKSGRPPQGRPPAGRPNQGRPPQGRSPQGRAPQSSTNSGPRRRRWPTKPYHPKRSGKG